MENNPDTTMHFALYNLIIRTMMFSIKHSCQLYCISLTDNYDELSELDPFFYDKIVYST